MIESSLYRSISFKDLRDLMYRARLHSSLKSVPRICLHENVNSSHHFMIQCLRPNQIIPFHRSASKTTPIYYQSYRGNILSDVRAKDSSALSWIPSVENSSLLPTSLPLVINESCWRYFVNSSSHYAFLLEIRTGPYVENDTIWSASV